MCHPSPRVLPRSSSRLTGATLQDMIRIEVREYMRISAKLLGLAYEKEAVTSTERQTILSYAQEIEKKFLVPPQQDKVPSAIIAPLDQSGSFRLE